MNTKSYPTPHTLSTLLLTIGGYVLWIGGNIIMGNLQALEWLGWLNNANIWLRALVATIPSAAQYYLSENWRNPNSLLARSKIFALGIIILATADLVGPDIGLLRFFGQLDPWEWGKFFLGLIPSFLCSWWGQEIAIDGTKQLWLNFRTPTRTPRRNEPTPTKEGIGA